MLVVSVILELIGFVSGLYGNVETWVVQVVIAVLLRLIVNVGTGKLLWRCLWNVCNRPCRQFLPRLVTSGMVVVGPFGWR